MSRIEEVLRDTLRERAATPPVVDGLADRAISGATRTRRRRRAGAVVATALCVVLAAVSASYLTVPGPGPAGPTVAASPLWPPSEPVRELRVDVLIDRYIFRAGGGLTSIESVVPDSCDGGRCISGVWRVDDGYLVAVVDNAAVVGGSVLWHVPESGQPRAVVDGDGALVVSDGTAQRPGVQVIWADDGRLNIGTYDAGRVIGVLSTPAPTIAADDRDADALDPWTVVGGAVVLSGPATGTQAVAWDVWFPDRGAYVPATYPVIGLHGTTVDHERILAWYYQEPNGPGCLGELQPEEFAPVRSRCPSPLSRDDRIYPSPDGQWWVVFGERGVALYDAGWVWQGGSALRRWSGSTKDGVWLDSSTLVILDRSNGTLVTYDIDGGEDRLTLPVPHPAVNVSVVSDLR